MTSAKAVSPDWLTRPVDEVESESLTVILTLREPTQLIDQLGVVPAIS